mmetsp:Transcript_80328/g.210989  ORF Transcript_80328/g.210989 Transcript_80328/m.210989 type:complete len:248 (+) Transcript_80328:1469-2212(+)
MPISALAHCVRLVVWYDSSALSRTKSSLCALSAMVAALARRCRRPSVLATQDSVHLLLLATSTLAETTDFFRIACVIASLSSSSTHLPTALSSTPRRICMAVLTIIWMDAETDSNFARTSSGMASARAWTRDSSSMLSIDAMSPCERGAPLRARRSSATFTALSRLKDLPSEEAANRQCHSSRNCRTWITKVSWCESAFREPGVPCVGVLDPASDMATIGLSEHCTLRAVAAIRSDASGGLGPRSSA